VNSCCSRGLPLAARDAANSGERRLPACSFRQLAEKPFEESRPDVSFNPLVVAGRRNRVGNFLSH
jgi:hypothetical protein